MQKTARIMPEEKKSARIKTGRKQTSIAKRSHADLIKILTGLFEIYLIIHKDVIPAMDGSIERKPISFSLTPSFRRKRIKTGPRHTVKKNVPHIRPTIK